MSKSRRILALLCAFTLALGGLAVAENADTSYGLPVAKTSVSQTVRVLLSRIGVTERMDLTLDGLYTLTVESGVTLAFQRGSTLAVLLKDGRMHVYYQGMSLDAGTALTLARIGTEADRDNGVRLANNEALYEGSLRLTVADGVIRPVLTMHVEEYLRGVVPYEMSTSFPKEALKAQAVAARTYVLYKSNPDRDYDVVDTTNDQVFKGRRAGNELAEQAVADTAGICGFYNGKVAMSYYSASNGGQTELVQHVWGTTENAAYYAMTDDPYDLENPQSTVRSVDLPKSAAAVADTPYVVRLLLATQLADTLRAQGFDPSPESLRVDAISAVSVDAPAFSTPSRLMTTLNVTFTYSARTRTDPPTPAPSVSTPAPDQEISLFATDAPTPTPAPTETPTATPLPTPSPEPTYGEFVPNAEPVTLHIPIFPTAEKALGLGINSNDNELVTVREEADRFVVESRRFGHGVGLSQRGAEWMALRYNKTFIEILAFYYPGMSLLRLPEDGNAAQPIDETLFETPGPAPTPTPKPTLMPVTQSLPVGGWYALVTEISDDSSLNLRAEPDITSSIVMRLYKNQRLLVLETCPQEGWVHVVTDAAEGYVLEKFLTRE